MPVVLTARQNFDVPAGPLAPALRRLTDESGLRILYETSVTDNVNTVGARGQYAPMQALEMLLTCTGVDYHLIGADTVLLKRMVMVPPLVLRDVREPKE